MDKFEYDIREIKPDEKFLDKLNEWGNEGWELVHQAGYTKDRITHPLETALDTRPIRETLTFSICTLKRKKKSYYEL